MRADISIAVDGSPADDFRVVGPDQIARSTLERALSAAGCDISLLGGPPNYRLRDGCLLPGEKGAGMGVGPQFRVVGGRNAGTDLPIPHGVSTIGRGPDCTHRLTDPEVSRTHVLVAVGPRHVTVRQPAVTNPASVNGVRLVGARALRPGDRLRLGTTVLQWQGRPEPLDRPKQTRFERPAAPVRSRSMFVILAALTPAVVTAAAVAFVGSSRMMIMALTSSVAMGAVVLIGRGQRGGRREHRDYLAKCRRLDSAVGAACQAEAEARRAADPEPDITHLGSRPLLSSARVRLGLGSAEAAVSLVDGPSTTRPLLNDVPVCIELEPSGLSLCAPAEIARGQARWVLLQLAATHPVRGLRIVLVLDKASEPHWRWARWLPHLAEVEVDNASRWDRGSPADPDARTVVIQDCLHAAPAKPRGLVVSIGSAAGACSASVADDTGIRQVLHRAELPVHFDADVVTMELAEATARRLAGRLADAASTQAVHLLDLLDLPAEPSAADIVTSWQRTGAGVSAPLGVGPDGFVSFDLDRDGPHALVGGTTGSGKSQLLQTLVVGLAARYPPDVTQFLLVDYKGGAAFGACDALPHTAGVLTDLDARLTGRALRSLSAELRRRERLLADAGVADIQAYQALGGRQTLPRLVVIVDEFATLATDLPDFVSGLVSIAQRGRSLGMHLVLATQRPGGAVSADIRANSNLRIALRTISTAESIDLIDTPAAAALDARTPGQAIRADSPAHPFQVADLGRRASTTDVVVTPLDQWRRARAEPAPAPSREPSGPQGIVAAIAAAANLRDTPIPAKPWQAELPDEIREVPYAGRRVPLGLVDLPDEQRQDVFCLDLDSAGVTVVAGGPRSGRSTALLRAAFAAAAKYEPTQLHIHALDYAGNALASLHRLPHVGTVATASQHAGVSAALLARLSAQDHDSDRPATLLLVDDWSALCQCLDAYDLGVSTARLRALLANARSLRLSAVICGDRAVLATNLAAVTDERFVLRCADASDYSLAGIANRDIPAHLPPGRGLRARDSAEIQFARPARRHFDDLAPDPTAVRVHDLPSRLKPQTMPRMHDRACLGVGGDSAEPVWLPLTGSLRMLVAGPVRSGKSALLCNVLAQLPDHDVLVAAHPSSPLHKLAVRQGHPVLSPGTTELPMRPGQWLLVDDAEDFAETPLGDVLAAHAASTATAMILTGSTDRLATAFRGPAAVAKRWRRGILLQPGLVDGELLGVRLDRTDLGGPTGRGVAVPDPAWGWPTAAGRPDRIPVQTWAPAHP